MLDDYDRGWRAGRRAADRHAKNPQHEVNDPKVPSLVADPAVYMRGWQDGWFDNP